MKQILQGKRGVYILAVVAGLVVAIAVAQILQPAQWYTVHTAIQDLAAGKNVAKSRTALETLNDRAYVLEKLQEAIEDDAYGITGKYNLLGTLTMFNQPRAIRRALESTSLSTQRAACKLLWGEAEFKDRCGEIALAWLKDPAAEDRGTAAAVCGHLGLADAQAVLLDIVSKDPGTVGEQALFQRALAGIKEPKPPELVDRLFKLASDPAMDKDTRGIALESLQRTKGGARDRVLQLSIDILKDQDGDPILRMKAALGLRDFPEDRAWDALEAVLVSDKEDDRTLQRNCLFALGQMEPADEAVGRRFIDRLRKLLVDRRVYNNPYFAIKVDVATALCALNAREPITLDIMDEYLVDEDPQDKQHLARQEAWLTLWTLTGLLPPDLPQPELFQRPPPPFSDPLAARDFLFRRASHRPGISVEQAAMVARIADNLALMQKTRQIHQGQRAAILEKWRREAEEAEKKEASGTPPQGPPGNVGPQGPQAPPANPDPQGPQNKEEKGSGGGGTGNGK
ncbi:MAG TPA: collagen-like protein [Planctomycetota bacterium]|nr:collagen-like protein [Planctomycetota bacterium]